ncbi:hypothetical protein [Aequorivita lipolytica]|uniref:Uncharacterized protein n=1 Tax=Aequorivita lipolytica TaxID=153267 RepID=A0A5C6YU21_9FLAO|nr:hypothetical protein [Aequorivita lipolytica]TXD70441.1 hypothetical protein ESV24_04570 [Aequorivita lipolytica]SRX50878.1 hypothetical protein AEQU2_01356 [Aequorivita lipolytica]
MKIFIYILIALATGLIIFNSTKLDFDQLFIGDSAVAAISILAGLCAILLLGILLVSKSIAAKVKK